MTTPSIIDALYLDRAARRESAHPAGRACGATSSTSTAATVTAEALADTDLELPRINYRRHNGRPYRYVYGVRG